VFSITGKLIKTISERSSQNGYRVTGINWDGRDEYGDRLAIGTYIYKLSIHNEKGEKVEKYEKLVILK
jgi:flagellar hook assembly protein FlgD